MRCLGLPDSSGICVQRQGKVLSEYDLEHLEELSDKDICKWKDGYNCMCAIFNAPRGIKEKNVNVEIKDNDLFNYFVHCYLYYVENSPIISDSEFDELCKKLLKKKIKHPLISEEDLKAGTGYAINEYPEEIIKAANILRDDSVKIKIKDEKEPLDDKDIFDAFFGN